MLKENMADKARLTPKAGFNVVGVDDYELPGSQLYLIGHFSNESKAKASLARFKKKNPGVTAHIYGPETL